MITQLLLNTFRMLFFVIFKYFCLQSRVLLLLLAFTVNMSYAADLFMVCNMNTGIQRRWHQSLQYRASIDEGDSHCLCRDHTHVNGPTMDCTSYDGKTLAIYRVYLKYGGMSNFISESWIENNMLNLKCSEFDVLGHCAACKRPWHQLKDVLVSGQNIRREYTSSTIVDKASQRESVWYQEQYEFKPKLNKKFMSTILYANISVHDQYDLDFEIRNQETVLWKSFRLDKSRVKWDSCADNENNVNCRNELFELPVDFFDTTLKVSSRSFISNNVESHPHVQYDTTLENSWKSKTGKLVKLSNGQWGFRSKGCTPPYFKFKVEWYESSMVQVGSSRRRRLMFSDHSELTEMGGGLYEDPQKIGNRKLLQQNTRNCLSRRIILMEVIDSDTSEMKCKMPYSVNTVRGNIKISREKTEKDLRASVWSETKDGRQKIYYSESVAKALMECASPSENSAVMMGGRWVGFTELTPGLCVECSSGIMKNANLQTRSCTSAASETSRECCYSCRPRYMIKPGTENLDIPRCVAMCRPGQEYSSVSEACTTCPIGKFSEGGYERCKTCDDLLAYNSKATSRGCETCGTRSYVDNIGSSCIPCPVGMFVAPNSSVCRGCPASQIGYFLPQRGEVTACVACPVGTYRNYQSAPAVSSSGSNIINSNQMAPSSDECILCPPNTFSATLGSLTCSSCPSGKRSVPNRTLCVNCATIDAMLYPNVIYAEEAGCKYQCNTSVSYAVGNIYSTGRGTQGCLDCSGRDIAIGMHMDLLDCSIMRRCSNGPSNSAVAVYTGPAPFKSAECPWKCKPGYIRNGDTCGPCPITQNGFVLSRHMYTDACVFTCRELLVRDKNLLCNETCVDLLSPEHSVNVLKRVRNYVQGSNYRPYYSLGVCGSSEKIPLSDIAFMRLGRWAYAGRSDEVAECGNSLLNYGEECDDGNTENDDGCNSECSIERDRYWDCDLIGEPCLPECGWSKSNVGVNEDWGLSLYGFVLPQCASGQCECTPSLNYYDVVRMQLGERRLHMTQTFISCDCHGNLMRQIDYELCTPQNRGCRACDAGKYHDDLLRECVPCGSRCMPGFTINQMSSTLCSTDVTSTMSMLEADPVIAQSLIGCTPCSKYGNTEIRFISSHLENAESSSYCAFKCYKDTTDSSGQSLDFYCDEKIDNRTGRCAGNCVSCAVRLQSISIQFQSQAGKYIKGCTEDDGGYSWAQCDPATKPPAYSEYIAFASESVAIENIDDERSCPWKCSDGAHYDVDRGICIICFDPRTHETAYPCTAGEYITHCGNTGLLVCVRCSGLTPYPMQVWTSKGPWFGECTPKCELGLAWNPNEEGNGACIACSHGSCEIGEKYIPCSYNNDTQCVPCENLLSMGENTEYVTGGSCATRCASGYFYSLDSMSCVSCSSLECETGQQLSTRCVNPQDRLVMPECIECSSIMPPLKEGERWRPNSPICQVMCIFGMVEEPFNKTCVLFNASLCGHGYRGSYAIEYDNSIAVTRLQCEKCVSSDDKENIEWKYAESGSCAIICLDGYEKNGIGQCIPEQTSIPNEPPQNVVILSPYYNKTFPSRRGKHSGM